LKLPTSGTLSLPTFRDNSPGIYGGDFSGRKTLNCFDALAPPATYISENLQKEKAQTIVLKGIEARGNKKKWKQK
jgi:hypothetical protein